MLSFENHCKCGCELIYIRCEDCEQKYTFTWPLANGTRACVHLVDTVEDVVNKLTGREKQERERL